MKSKLSLSDKEICVLTRPKTMLYQEDLEMYNRLRKVCNIEESRHVHGQEQSERDAFINGAAIMYQMMKDENLFKDINA